MWERLESETLRSKWCLWLSHKSLQEEQWHAWLRTWRSEHSMSLDPILPHVLVRESECMRGLSLQHLEWLSQTHWIVWQTTPENHRAALCPPYTLHLSPDACLELEAQMHLFQDATPPKEEDGKPCRQTVCVEEEEEEEEGESLVRVSYGTNTFRLSKQDTWKWLCSQNMSAEDVYVWCVRNVCWYGNVWKALSLPLSSSVTRPEMCPILCGNVYPFWIRRACRLVDQPEDDAKGDAPQSSLYLVGASSVPDALRWWETRTKQKQQQQPPYVVLWIPATHETIPNPPWSVQTRSASVLVQSFSCRTGRTTWSTQPYTVVQTPGFVSALETFRLECNTMMQPWWNRLFAPKNKPSSFGNHEQKPSFLPDKSHTVVVRNIPWQWTRASSVVSWLREECRLHKLSSGDMVRLASTRLRSKQVALVTPRSYTCQEIIYAINGTPALRSIYPFAHEDSKPFPFGWPWNMETDAVGQFSLTDPWSAQLSVYALWKGWMMMKKKEEETCGATNHHHQSWTWVDWTAGVGGWSAGVLAEWASFLSSASPFRLHMVLVEQNEERARLLEQNMHTTWKQMTTHAIGIQSTPSMVIVQGDCLHAMQEEDDSHMVCVIDPPWGGANYQEQSTEQVVQHCLMEGRVVSLLQRFSRACFLCKVPSFVSLEWTQTVLDSQETHRPFFRLCLPTKMHFVCWIPHDAPLDQTNAWDELVKLFASLCCMGVSLDEWTIDHQWIPRQHVFFL